jgi:hypothetical protein
MRSTRFGAGRSLAAVARLWVFFPRAFFGDFAMMKRLWCEDEGVLTFEWIMLLTLLVIGVIGGVAGIRDAIIHECQGVIGAMVSLDQSYVVQPPLGVAVLADNSQAGGDALCTSSAASMGYADSANVQNGRVNVFGQTITFGNTLCQVTEPLSQ